LLLHRFAALAAGAVFIAVVVLAAMLAVRGSARLDTIGVGNFAAQALDVALLGLLFGALAIGIGAATGGPRSVVFGVTAGLGVLTYALHGFAPQVGADWLRYLTPLHYYIDGEPLTNGLNPGHAATLAATILVLLTAATWRLGRRDLGR
jgi:ABC-2 type transport system permease protein